MKKLLLIGINLLGVFVLLKLGEDMNLGTVFIAVGQMMFGLFCISPFILLTLMMIVAIREEVANVLDK